MELEPGADLQGKYLLTSSIGRGGMGEVFAAERLSDGREVAIKVVSRRIVDDTLMARLEREAVAARRIRSQYVPEVYEVDRTADGELFLVMRLLHGEPLSQRLRDRRGLPWPEVKRIVDDVLSALGDAHAAGVVHRDLKPGNIFLEQVEVATIPGGTPSIAWMPNQEPERAMILDFGVCKIDTSDGPKLTVTGESVGTVSYMAPEQIRGASEVDGRADLYALAMVAFEAVCGRIAFDATGQMAILAAKLEGRARRVRDCAIVSVPAGLDALVAKALSRKPHERFANAKEMQLAWRSLGPPTEAPRATASQSVPPTYATQNALTAGTQTRMGITPRIGVMLAGACFLVAAVAVGLLLRRPLPHPPPTIVETDPPLVSSELARESIPPSDPIVVELGDDTPIDAGVGHPRNRWTRHPNVASSIQTPPPNGTHITTKPRY